MISFPDLPHLFQLQADLWRWPKSRAAVMVGAGLSLNAHRIPCSNQKFLTWRELTRCMYDELNPVTELNGEIEKRKRNDHFLSCDSLRIASEYEAEFGRAKLENLIRGSLPDSEYQPSDLHKLLLELPWADVFTTNYDTLLERVDILGKPYQTITKAEDLIRAFQPRIVKLHGSFPNQTPFIITEEDFRTYPHKFSPFVNTVQQSLTENAFVLLGFSGDDPNFKSWTGWIRDNLSNRHAPIYLVGFLNISNAERSLLSARGVTPIDLAQVITGQIKGNRHEISLRWFLNFLHSSRPPRPEDWPDIKKGKASEIPGTLKIPALRLGSPAKKTYLPNRPFDDKRATQIIERWQYERMNYPGWIILSSTKREDIWDETSRAESHLWELSKNWGIPDKLRLSYELNWRYEISLMPLFGESVENMMDILLSDKDEENLGGEVIRHPLTEKMGHIGDQELDDLWLTLALSLLKEARETFRDERWKLISGKIDERFGDTVRAHDRYLYEKALWAIRNLERDKAGKIVKNWNPAPRTPIAAMWKSAILAEIGQLVEARSTLLNTLNEIRKSFTTQGRNTELLSLEGWCSYSLASIEGHGATSYDANRMSEFKERWDELKAWDCDPRVLGQYFLHELAKPMPELTSMVSKSTQSFDPGITTNQNSWRSNILSDFMPAFGCLRLLEDAGVSMRNSNSDWRDAVIKSCKWTAPFNSFGSTVILASLIDAKKLDDEGFLTRLQIANMTQEDIDKLYEWAFSALQNELSAIKNTRVLGRDNYGIIQTLVEILSRISIGLSNEKLSQVLQLAIDYFSNPQIRSDHDAARVNYSLFKRVFFAADRELLESWIEKIMLLPLDPIVDDARKNRLDPIDVFPENRCKSSQKLPTEKFSAVFESLLKVAKSRNKPQSDDAFKRLFSLSILKKTTEEENVILGEEIWRETDQEGFPTIRVYGKSNFLFLPSPSVIDVAGLLRTHLLAAIAGGMSGEDDWDKINYHEVPSIIKGVANCPCRFAAKTEDEKCVDWTNADALYFYNVIIRWWARSNKPLEGYSADVPMRQDAFNPFTETIPPLGRMLARVVVPKMGWATEAEWDQLYNLVREVEATGKYIYICLPFVLMHRPQDFDRVKDIIFESLNSSVEGRIEAAAKAIGWWAWGRRQASLPNMPHFLLVALIDRVCHREPFGLTTIIQVLNDVIENYPEELDSELVAMLARSLVSWSRILFRPIEGDRASFNSDIDLNQCHALGVLAASIDRWLSNHQVNAGQYDGISIWRDNCEKSRLPELKRCFSDDNLDD